MSELGNVMGFGVVTPPSEPTPFVEDSMDLKIVAVDPENGYDKEGEPCPSENAMVAVVYPEGNVKRHQCKDVSTLLAGVSAYVQHKFGFSNFEFEAVPSKIEAGAEIKLKRGVNNGD